MNNPTQPAVKLTIAGAEYSLVFDLQAIAAAEEVSGLALVTGLTKKNVSSPQVSLVRAMLYGAMRRHHPGVTPEEVSKLITLVNIGAVWNAVLEAWIACMAEAQEERENPPQAHS